MGRSRGFSLIELLIVVSVILIIVAIVVPNLMRAKISANESSATQSLRQITTAELSYHASYPQVGYAPTLAELGGPAANCTPGPATACIIDSVLTTGQKSGYNLFAAGFDLGGSGTNTQFVASAAPITFNSTGVRNFCVATDDGSLRVQIGSAGGTPVTTVANCLAYSLLR
jgi:type IV pilus assembly protein PilA